MSVDAVKKLSKDNKDEGVNRPSSAPADGSGHITTEKKSQNWNVKSILATWTAPYPPKPGGSQSSLQPYQNSVGNTRTFPLRSKLNPGGSLLGLNRGFENLVRRAIRQHKVFCVHPHFPAIRRALLNRGWVEKTRGLNVTISNPNRASLAEITNKSDNETEDAWLLRGLREYPADFVWVFLGDYVNWSTILPTQTISWHPSSPFTSKVGICACLQQSHWVSEVGTATTHFPRCYRLGVEEERIAFTSDFKLTACLGLLKWIIGAYEREGDRGVIDASSHTLPVCVDFAVRQVSHYARVRRHEDVDWISPPTVTAYQWEVFLSQYYEVVVQKGKLAIGEPENTARHMYESSLKALQRVAPFWPQLLADGTNNIWICKPGARNRGIGIVLMNNLEKILNSLMSQNFLRDSNWVVQKYIERPMLVYKTKFDIRQWFIVTDWSPLTVWFYKESYMRFCSKPFSLEDLDESIHLCNNAVQIKYKNAESRDSALPEENMWDNYTFIAYLRTIGKPDLWEKVVYPGMKQAILCVLLSSQEEISVRKNSFELYGADFMLSDNYTPWLIEINSSPCMAPTTSVTARMCNQCLFDLVKVVIDRRNNTNANTGLFELVYKQTSPTSPNYFPSSDMTIKGRRLGRDVDWPSVVTKCSNKKGGKCDDQSLLEPVVTTSTGSIDSQRLTFQELVSRLRFKDAQAKLPIEYVASSSMTPIPQPIPPPVMNEEDSMASVNPSKSMASQTKRSSLSKKHGKSKGNPARFVSSKEAEKETKRNVQFNPEKKQEEQKRTKSADSSEQQRPRPSGTVSDSTLTRPKRKKAHSESPAKKRVKSSDPELQPFSSDATKDKQNDHALKSSPPKLTNTTISKPNAAVAAAKLSLSLDKGAVKPFSSLSYNRTHSTAVKGSSQRETTELAAIMNSDTNPRADSTHSLPPMPFQSPKSSVPTDERSSSFNSTSSGAKELKQADVVTSKENAKTSSTASNNKSQSVRTIPVSLNLPLPTTTSKVPSPFKPRRGTGLTPQTLAANRFKPKAPNTETMTATLAPIAEEVKTSDPDSAATKTLGSGYRKTDTGSASGGTAASADFHRPRPTTIFASGKNHASGNARNIGGPSGAKAQNPTDKVMESNANPQVQDSKLAEMSSSDKSHLNKNDNS